MGGNKLRVVVLTRGNPSRLLELLSVLERVEVAGVFIETATVPARTLRKRLERSIRYDGYSATVKKLWSSIAARTSTLHLGQSALDELAKLSRDLKIPITKVEDFHADRSIELLKRSDADLGIVFGTNILKESVFGVPRLGSINLHQGKAPFYRGGPTVFWELFNGEIEIGITIHFVASQVDTGDIILQETLPLNYDFSLYGLDYERFLADFRFSLAEPSAQLLASATSLIANGEVRRKKQDTSLGKRYRLPTKKEKNALLRVLKRRMQMYEETLRNKIIERDH